MDPSTRRAYAAGAATYERNRPPIHADHARALVERTGATEPIVLDAGCGTGAYVPVLAEGSRVVALDAVIEMVERASGSRRLQGDLLDLPLRTGAFDGVWSRNSLVHLAPGALERALAEMHRAVRVGGRATVSLHLAPHATFVSDDDLPGRTFHTVDADQLVHLFVGAGFDDVSVEVDEGRSSQWVTARRAWSLPDYVDAGLAVLVCGLNPSPTAADTGVGYSGPGNRFWPAAEGAGLVTRQRDPRHALLVDGVGMTDLVKRTTRAAAELTPTEYRSGLARIEALCRRLRPKVVVFVGLTGWRAAVDRRAVPGWQERTLGPTPVYVMGSTSGLNARTGLAELTAHLRTVATYARRT